MTDKSVDKVFHEFSNCTYPHPSKDYFCSWCDRLPTAKASFKTLLLERLPKKKRIDYCPSKECGFNKALTEVTQVIEELFK